LPPYCILCHLLPVRTLWPTGAPAYFDTYFNVLRTRTRTMPVRCSKINVLIIPDMYVYDVVSVHFLDQYELAMHSQISYIHTYIHVPCMSKYFSCTLHVYFSYTYIHTEKAPQRGTHKEPTRGSWGKSKSSKIKNQNHQWSTR
jgi:hypothetical protein